MSKKLDKRILLSAPHMSGNEMKYVAEAFDSNWVAPLGPNVISFEKEMVSFLSGSSIYAVAMSSGTAAIHIALRLLGIKEREEVLCSSLTFVASANPILYEKCTPVFIDSECETWNMCPDALLMALETKRKQGRIPRFLICTDLFGMSANYSRINEICDSFGVQVIEDAAESLGSSLNEKKCSTFGRFGILSFNGNKIITTSGGGMLITHAKEEADKALHLITQARDPAPYYLHSEVGFNYRMSNISAGIGRGQLEVLENRVAKRRANFKLYQQALSGEPIRFDDEPSGHFSNRWLATGVLETSTNKTPSELIAYLSDLNIEARHVWKPLHTQPLFSGAEFFTTKGKDSVSEHLFARGICLPSGSALSEEDLHRVTAAIKEFF